MGLLAWIILLVMSAALATAAQYMLPQRPQGDRLRLDLHSGRSAAWRLHRSRVVSRLRACGGRA
jgi:hypothetical protein